MEVHAAAAESGAEQSQNLVGQGSSPHPVSSLLTMFQGVSSLETMLPRFDTQAGGGGGLGGPSLGAGGLGVGVPGQGGGATGLRIIPVVTMSERYDTNVFFAPKLPGLDRQDWVTTISPRLALQDNGRVIGTTLSAGAIGEYYAKNAGLSYVGYNAAGSLNLTGLLRRFVPEASLYVSGSYSYTPIPPAFLSGGSGQANPAVGEEITSQLPVADTYIRGIQSQRVNTTIYTGSMAGAINLTQNSYIQGSYGYAVSSFGGTPAVTGQVSDYRPLVSDTTTHSLSISPTYKLTAQESMNFNYQYLKAEFGGNQGGFDSHSATMGYQRAIDGFFRVHVYGGASLYSQDQGGQQVTTSTASGQQVAFTGGGGLTWARRNTQATVTYSIGLYPNYVGVPGVVLSSNLSMQAAQRVSDDAVATVSLNYADNRPVGDQAGQGGQAGIEFRSYNTSESLSYRVSRSFFVTATHEWGLYTGNFTGQGEDKIIRNAVTVSLTKAW